MLILGHRGASAEAPENTLEAFHLALSQRADGVELDAMLCGSGEVVVCHDDRLDRLAGIDWMVSRLPWARLREVDVGSRLGFRVAHIPLLRDVLGSLPSHALINVELKCDTLADSGLTRAVAKIVGTGNADRVLFSSFNAGCLFRLSLLRPNFRRGYLVAPDKNFFLHGRVIPRWLANHSVHPDRAICSTDRVARWRRAGLNVAAWTVDDPTEAWKLSQMGVSYCITNRPAHLRSGILEQSKIQTHS